MGHHQLTSRILIPLDGSELATIAIPWARALSTPETELVLARATPDPTPMSELAGTSAFPISRVVARHRHVADDYLDAVADVLDDAAPVISTASVLGDPSEAILKLIDERDVTMVIVASHGRGFLGRVVVGSVADRIARAASVPVLVIHPTRGQVPAHADDTARVDRLVAPLDGSQLARQALPILESLARQCGAPVHLVRALPTREDVAVRPGQADAAYYEELIGAASDALEAEAGHLRAGGLTVTTSGLIGSPAATILDELRAGDMVVMTSHGLGGVRRWLLGSVAERIIRAGEAPVLLVPVAARHAFDSGGE